MTFCNNSIRISCQIIFVNKHWTQSCLCPFNNWTFIMKLQTKTLHVSSMRMCPIDFGVQRSMSQCTYYWKWFMWQKCFKLPFTPITVKLHTKTLHALRMCPIDFGVKKSRSLDTWKVHITADTINPGLLICLTTLTSIPRATRLSDKLLVQGCVEKHLKSSLRNQP